GGGGVGWGGGGGWAAIVMRCGIGPPEELRRHGIRIVHAVRGVGRNLVDHPLVCMHVRCARPVTLATAESPVNLLRYLARRRGPLTSNGTEAAVFARTRADVEAPDLEIAFAAVLYQREWEQPPDEHGFTPGGAARETRSRGFWGLRAAGTPCTPPLSPPIYYIT